MKVQSASDEIEAVKLPNMMEINSALKCNRENIVRRKLATGNTVMRAIRKEAGELC